MTVVSNNKWPWGGLVAPPTKALLDLCSTLYSRRRPQMRECTVVRGEKLRYNSLCSQIFESEWHDFDHRIEGTGEAA
jgi:hypothetical protein